MFSLITTISHTIAKDTPAPAAPPSTAAITGFEQLYIDLIDPFKLFKDLYLSSSVIVRLVCKLFKSPPAQKNPPAPVITIEYISLFSSAIFIDSCNSS